MMRTLSWKDFPWTFILKYFHGTRKNDVFIKARYWIYHTCVLYIWVWSACTNTVHATVKSNSLCEVKIAILRWRCYLPFNIGILKSYRIEIILVSMYDRDFNSFYQIPVSSHCGNWECPLPIFPLLVYGTWRCVSI